MSSKQVGRSFYLSSRCTSIIHGTRVSETTCDTSISRFYNCKTNIYTILNFPYPMFPPMIWLKKSSSIDSFIFSIRFLLSSDFEWYIWLKHCWMILNANYWMKNKSKTSKTSIRFIGENLNFVKIFFEKNKYWVITEPLPTSNFRLQLSKKL